MSASTRAGISTGDPKSTPPVAAVAGGGGVDDDDHLRTTRPLHLTLDQRRERQRAEVVLLLERIRRTRRRCRLVEQGAHRVVDAALQHRERHRIELARHTTHPGACRPPPQPRLTQLPLEPSTPVVGPGCGAPTPAHACGTADSVIVRRRSRQLDRMLQQLLPHPRFELTQRVTDDIDMTAVTSPSSRRSPNSGTASRRRRPLRRPRTVTQIGTGSVGVILLRERRQPAPRSSPRAPPAPRTTTSTGAHRPPTARPPHDPRSHRRPHRSDRPTDAPPPSS